MAYNKPIPLTEDQSKFLTMVLEHDFTRWPILIKRILKSGSYLESEKYKLNQVRTEFLDFKQLYKT